MVNAENGKRSSAEPLVVLVRFGASLNLRLSTIFPKRSKGRLHVLCCHLFGSLCSSVPIATFGKLRQLLLAPDCAFACVSIQQRVHCHDDGDHSRRNLLCRKRLQCGEIGCVGRLIRRAFLWAKCEQKVFIWHLTFQQDLHEEQVLFTISSDRFFFSWNIDLKTSKLLFLSRATRPVILSIQRLPDSIYCHK